MTTTPQWLEIYISDNLPSLNLSNTNYQDWFDDFIQTLESRGLSKPSQQKNYLTNVRNAIKILDPNHPALEVIKFSTETWIEINKQDRSRIANRSTKLIDNPDAIVNQAIELVKTNHWSDIAAGLAVLTGRRCGEILKTAQFQYKTEYSLTFKGALKRKTEAVDLVFEIPVLCPANLILEAIDSLRLQLGDEVKNLSISQINQRYEERVAQKCDRHFSDLIPTREGKDNLYSHLFRAVYATIACHWYCPHTVPEMEFRAAIQGHYQILNEKDDTLRRSLAAGRHYFDYKIADASGNIDGRLGIKLGLPQVQVIEQFQQHQQPNSSSFNNYFRNKHHRIFSPDNQPKSKSKLTMNTNQHNDAVVSLQLPLSRLETISNLLNLSHTETINVLVDWAEVGISLAQHLNIDHPTPEALISRVQELEQNSVKSDEKPLDHQTLTNDDEHHRLLLSVSSLSNSVEFLTKALVEAKSYSTERRVVHKQGDRQPQPNSNHDHPNPNSKHKTRRISPENRERDTPEVMTEDINHAINAILDFNNAPDRPHRQKFRISIKPVADLTGRATNSVSKILKERTQEIEQHHQNHQISSYHNKSRRDENGNDFPPVDSEPDIIYHKISEVV